MNQSAKPNIDPGKAHFTDQLKTMPPRIGPTRAIQMPGARDPLTVSRPGIQPAFRGASFRYGLSEMHFGGGDVNRDMRTRIPKGR